MFMDWKANTVKMSILPKLISIKISARLFFFFINVDKVNLKCLWKEKEKRTAKTILTKKNKRYYSA